MFGSNSAACCRAVSSGSGGGVGSGSGKSGPDVGLPGGTLAATILPSKGGSILQQIAQAAQAAIHGSDTVDGSGSGTGEGYSTGEVIDFPMRDAYGPIKRAGRPPVSGLLAFPAPQVSAQPARNKRFIQVKMVPKNSKNQVDYSPATPFGWVPAMGESIPGGYTLGSGGSGGGKLATVLGTIQNTLPETIAALRANPNNLTVYPPGQSGGGLSNPLGQQQAPQGYYYDNTGTLRQVGASVGSAVGNIGQSISNFVQTNPLLVLGGGAALFLLFMKPPSRRR